MLADTPDFLSSAHAGGAPSKNTCLSIFKAQGTARSRLRRRLGVVTHAWETADALGVSVLCV